MYILAIDPGITGAVALLGPDARLLVYDIPVKVLRERKGKTRGGKARKPAMEVDVTALSTLLQALALVDPAHVILEDVWGMSGQGASQFSLGDSVGAIRAALYAAGLTPQRVAPARWTAGVGIRGSKAKATDKAPNLALARQLFPDKSASFSRKKDNGRADAALIAYWASRYLCN